MKLVDLYEARKNPNNNPKITIAELMYNELAQTKDTVGEGTVNLFVSFTSLEKLGINPQSQFETPLGIYCYPVEYVKQVVGDLGSEMSELPFAGSAKYANVFKVKGNVIDLPKMSKDQLSSYVEQMKVLCEKYNVPPNFITHFQKLATTNEYTKQSPGGHFWFITMKLAEKMSQQSADLSRSVKWNKVFRDLDVDVCCDSGGGIIHTNEPTQVVVVNPRCIYNNKQFHNVTRIAVHELDILQRTTNIDYAMSIIEKNPTAYIDYVPGIFLSKILEKYPNVIQYVNNPTTQNQELIGEMDINNLLYVKPNKLNVFVLINLLDTQVPSFKFMVRLVEKNMKIITNELLIEEIIRVNYKCSAIFMRTIKANPNLIELLKQKCIQKNDLDFFNFQVKPVTSLTISK